MDKLFYLFKIGRELSFSVAKAYLYKLARIPLSERQLGIIAYYNVLINRRLTHLKSDEEGFFFKNASEDLFYARAFPSSDFQVFDQILVNEEYRIIIETIKDRLSNGKIRIIDAGANVGFTTIYLNKKLSDKFEVESVCIEPSDRNVEVLNKNIYLNNLVNVKVEKAGLYNKSCYLKINHEFRDGKDWSIQVEESDLPTGLKAVEILDLMKKYSWSSVDFLKIDIEGAEKSLFADACYAKSFLEKVKIISVEVHQEYISEEVVLKILEENDFVCQQTGEITIGINKNLVNIR